MKTVKLFVLLLGMTLLTISGCARHYGMGDASYSVDRGVKEMMALVEKTVQDPEKAKRVQGVVTELVAEVKQSYQQSREFHKKLYELNANYEATPEEFTKILDEMNNNRMRSATKILGHRFKMKEMMTAQEWKAMSDGMIAARSRYGYGREGAEGGKGGM
ncbi:MAG: hypothetical protein HY581_08285 [Nitrospirae bacterium]|nr:hypothetical protein [Nitrospirota bacterium]